MLRFSFLSHRSYSAPYVEQMKLCLFCLWLRAMALAKKSGNAFDTASLLIALLRSVGIESRYVYGTVDIPAEQLMNWVGDAKTPDAAQQILEQGGIPNTALNLELAVLASGIAILGLGGGGIF
jgi:hypothetical protein